MVRWGYDTRLLLVPHSLALLPLLPLLQMLAVSRGCAEERMGWRLRLQLQAAQTDWREQVQVVLHGQQLEQERTREQLLMVRDVRNLPVALAAAAVAVAVAVELLAQAA